MNTIVLPDVTYRLLQQRAQAVSRTPDQVADELLRLQLEHPHLELGHGYTKDRVVIKGSRVSVANIAAYLRMGETPETIVSRFLPFLSLEQVLDAATYYRQNWAEVDAEMVDEETSAMTYFREKLGDESYARIVKQHRGNSTDQASS